MAKATTKAASKSKPALPELPPIEAPEPTGDAALDALLAAISEPGTAKSTVAVLAADRRPSATVGLRHRASAIARSIARIKWPKKPSRAENDRYLEIDGEINARVGLLGFVLEALGAHRDAAANAQVVELMQSHHDERVKLVAARALLGERVSQRSAPWGPLDPAHRGTADALREVVKLGQAKKTDVFWNYIADLASKALAEPG